MSIATRADPKLWELVKLKLLRSGDGKWNARKAMLAVQEYKRRGGKYIGNRKSDNSLTKWKKEDWNYIDGDKNSRYLPAKVRSKLTDKEKIAEKRRKAGRKGEWIPYTPSVNEKMRKAGIYDFSKLKKPVDSTLKKPLKKPLKKTATSSKKPLKKTMTS
jgi:MinD-like ATPase involved in chromosome partitioning or flagellar assembly